MDQPSNTTRRIASLGNGSWVDKHEKCFQLAIVFTSEENMSSPPNKVLPLAHQSVFTTRHTRSHTEDGETRWQTSVECTDDNAKRLTRDRRLKPCLRSYVLGVRDVLTSRPWKNPSVFFNRTIQKHHPEEPAHFRLR